MAKLWPSRNSTVVRASRRVSAGIVVPAMVTSTQGVTLKVLDSIKEAVKDAKDSQRENRNKGKN